MSGYLRDISPHQRKPLARKILLADDSVTAQNMGRKILADAGYEVITVNNGSAALKKIGEQHPDVIVLDVYMPGYSGLEVCQRLKEASDTSRIPILLTVGKLEPFKPEEAKRARADGFIVKPFEASELLSALTKLEDKIVPRNESSKPGRFSRAMASIEDPRLEKPVPYDKTMAVEEDAGWKNRISFPTKDKKKETGAEEPVHQQASRDRRPVMDQAPAANGRQSEDERVNVGALAPEGLPKDVTPEEIAALAAAAARVKGKIVEAAPEMKVEAPAQAGPLQDSGFEEYARVIPTPEPETRPEPKIETQKPEAPIESIAKVAEPPATPVAPTSVEQPTAIAESASSESASGQEQPEPTEEPVTMAVGSSSQSAASHSRWTAVSVALTPEDAGISLEEEMQKAYAAYAAAETGHSGTAAVASEASLAAISPSRPEEPTPREPATSVPASLAPEDVQPLSEVASAATEAVTAAVQELQNVATSLAEQRTESATDESAGLASSPEPAAASVSASQFDGHSPVPAAESEMPQEFRASAEGRDSQITSEPSSLPEGSTSTPARSSEPKAEPASDKTPDLGTATAVAWDSWKRVQESGQGDGRSSLDPSAAAPQDTAAMAAAVGGKNPVEESKSAAENDSAIASIVDSVLADLRPKIVEEISRKLGKKQ